MRLGRSYPTCSSCMNFSVAALLALKSSPLECPTDPDGPIFRIRSSGLSLRCGVSPLWMCGNFIQEEVP